MIKQNERLDDLECNNLHIIQDPSGYCFTSDSVILSNLVSVKKTDKVIDLCTGSGVIALLVAGKYSPNKIVGVELQPRLADMAKRSVAYNNLNDIIEIINANVIGIEKTLGCGTFDVVVINPPYDKCIEKENYTEKEICKKEVYLNVEQTVDTASKLLKFGGLFYMINKVRRLSDVIYYMKMYNIEPKKIYFIHPKASLQADTFIVEGKKGANSGLVLPLPIVVYNEDGTYTDFSRRLYNK